MDKIKNRSSIGHRAMVASGRPEATNIGIEILRKGGNAVDASVAIGFAMGIAEPATSGMGGGGFMIIKQAEKDEPDFIDFRESAPGNAGPDMWTYDESGNVLNMENKIGAKSVSIPGEAAGLIEALERYGTMELKEVLAPSISLAERGVRVSPLTLQLIQKYAPYLERCRDAKRIFLNRGNGYRVGEQLKNPELAESLTKVSEDGMKVFYEGEIADSIVNSLQSCGGIVTKEDLRDYRTEIKDPVVGKYRDYTIFSSSPPSSGGVHVIQTLNILENFDVGKMEVNSAEYLHLFSEVFKFVYEDRARFMGDTNFVNVPVNGIRSKEYARILGDKIDAAKARNPNHDDPWNYEHDETTHYSIGDKSGNLVSTTKTINHFFGSCLAVGGTGILLNNTMADFSTRKYDVNAVERNKKPRSTMAPTIIFKNGFPFAIVGSPGGSNIINAVVQVISKLIDHEMDIQQAIDSPRITQNTSNVVFFEDRIETRVVADLRRMGHETCKRQSWDRRMGGVHAIKYREESVIEGGADPRREGNALGI